MLSGGQNREEVYIIENRRYIRKASVIRRYGEFAVIALSDGAEICLRKSRLYGNREKAETAMKEQRRRCPDLTRTGRSPGYMDRLVRKSDLGPYAYPH